MYINEVTRIEVTQDSLASLAVWRSLPAYLKLPHRMNKTENHNLGFTLVYTLYCQKVISYLGCVKLSTFLGIHHGDEV